MSNVVLTVGNTMMGDDGAGPLLAQMLNDNPIDGWQVIDGGAMPENVVHQVRRLEPQRVIVVDAADFGEKAGEIRLINPATIAEMFIMSTHALPLNFLIDELKQTVPEVEFIGIQPAIVAFSFPMTDMVKDAVTTVYQTLPAWQPGGSFSTI
ncbi:hydrogenase maturation peptidase HycI [Ferrimonas lipolytica]|uniref:Hydrogenase maturation peptidase HycI n=1 Tax=Ferrimonas lipolytica TaxID=2724191 RepID=A0A6H1UCD4_9GAMM|nr:hydrogenase maturation peptidase HycI [Ferrimonas lipolytica]QIZ76240.1 hydrogenase maturation peptidase HycI [Ferrimonas lipolytica]